MEVNKKILLTTIQLFLFSVVFSQIQGVYVDYNPISYSGVKFVLITKDSFMYEGVVNCDNNNINKIENKVYKIFNYNNDTVYTRLISEMEYVFGMGTKSSSIRSKKTSNKINLFYYREDKLIYYSDWFNKKSLAFDKESVKKYKEKVKKFIKKNPHYKKFYKKRKNKDEFKLINTSLVEMNEKNLIKIVTDWCYRFPKYEQWYK